MASLKQNLKQLLINRQHKLYEKEVKARNLTYDRWIREQEKQIKIASSIFLKDDKCLTNDFEKLLFGGCKDENEGNHSEKSESCRGFAFSGQEAKNRREATGIFLPLELFCSKVDAILWNFSTDVILLSLYGGKVNEIALPIICEKLLENESIILIYGDEDIQEENVRENPWFKPDWSPDRFLSCFYFGGLVAVRTRMLREAYLHCKERGLLERLEREQDTEGRSVFFEQVEMLYLLLFEMMKQQNAFVKGHDSSGMPVCHIRQVLYHSKKDGYEQIKDCRLPGFAVRNDGQWQGDDEETSGTESLLSIIIPSKDNPGVLFHCIDSLLERTRSPHPFELILVDNGSNDENRRLIEEKAERLNQHLKEKDGGKEIDFRGCSYLYQPMTFNFSRMCNLGAEKAKGELLLFLNDDMEIIQPDWMELMVEKALLPYAGAVGAKLLYPDSETIQHAGITNLRVGPAHKLQFLDDGSVYYYGMNRGVHDMLAVTGACLMVRREVFEQAGGFCEKLAVAFNDVDLCYTIYEKGYYNIERCDVVFYHHESLSRGKDGESEEKQLRLLREKDVLYERHQELYGKDPFYHPYLTTDMLESEYSPAYHYQVTLDMPWSKAVLCTSKIEKAKDDQCLVVGMECAMDIYKWQYGVVPEKGKIKVKPEDMGYYFQGYSFVIGADNACYNKKLLLRNRENKQVWAIQLESRYRKDIKNNLKDQLNVDLTGFAAKMRRDELPSGVYQFGMLAEDRCSRQKLINWSSWVLEIE